MEKITARIFSENFRNKAVILFFASLVLLICGLVGIAPNSNPYFTSALGILTLLLSLAFFGKYLMWRSGAIGEEIVLKELSKIVDVRIYNDFKIPGYSWNIDHIILSKNGLFIIETKNHSGEILIKNNEWIQRVTKNSKVYENKMGNPVAQARMAAAKLNNFLKERGFSLPWVSPIVVFADENVKVDVETQTTPVIKRNQLASFIEKQGQNLDDAQIKSIDAILSSIAKQNNVPILTGLNESGWFSTQLNNAKFGLVFGIFYTLFIGLLFWEITIDDITYGVIFQGIASFILGALVLECFGLNSNHPETRWLAISLIGLFFLNGALVIFGLDILSLKNWLVIISTRIFITLTTLYVLRIIRTKRF